MGAHHARQTSQVGRIAGRGAFTAAAALALTGGTASLAFAGEAPHDADHASTLHAADLEKHYGDKVADLEHKGDDALWHGSESVHGLTGSLADIAGGDEAKASEKKIYDKVADGQHKVVDAKGKASEQVHHLTGSSAAKLDDSLTDARERGSDEVDDAKAQVSDRTSETGKTPSILSFT